MAELFQIDGPTASFTANAALVKHTRVKLLSTNKIDAAAAADPAIGYTVRDVASGGTVAVRLLSNPSQVGRATAAAIAVGGDVFSAASGRVASTGTVKLGTAKTATSGTLDDLVVFIKLDS